VSDPAPVYRPGDYFQCWKRPRTFDPTAEWGERVGEPCGATIVMHGFHWCAQVCPSCLANYRVRAHAYAEPGPDVIVASFGGYYPPDTERSVRANIARNGGQYVPTFD
jgi:hypothetical protein